MTNKAKFLSIKEATQNPEKEVSIRGWIHRERGSAKIKFIFLTIAHFASYLVIVGFFYKKIAESRMVQKEVVEELKKQVSETFVELSFADKSQLEKSWLNSIDMFKELMSSEKIWDITYAEGVDRVKARTMAQTATKRNKSIEQINWD